LGTPLTTDEMISTIGGNGYRCEALDNCAADCDPVSKTVWQPNAYITCTYNPPGSCENDTEEQCAVDMFQFDNCSGYQGTGYHGRPACAL
jgi:hypothetical protein